MIVLDPGHGGIDSGAVRGDARESALMMSFAKELAEQLIRSGRFRVALTRNDDTFLRLSQRIAKARDMGAWAFVSLHADALEEQILEISQRIYGRATIDDYVHVHLHMYSTAIVI